MSGMYIRKGELAFYLSVYVGYLAFTLKSVVDVNDEIVTLAKFGFSNGWTFLGRPRDDSNDDYENLTEFVINYWHFYLLHVTVSTLVRWHCPKFLPQAHALITMGSLYWMVHPWTITLLAALIISYRYCARYQAKYITWLLSAFWMWILVCIKDNSYIYRIVGYDEYTKMILLISWSVLRCSSFNLSRINNMHKGIDCDKMYALRYFLGYTLYFPTIVFGPIFGYHRYTYACIEPEVLRLNRQLFFVKISNLIKNLVVTAFWWTAMRFMLHYIYIHYMMFDATVVRLVQPTFIQYGVGYFMGQFFFMFYVIAYGIGIAFAHYDGLNPPSRPQCIGRIHFYSDMWKYFDEGLYEFLFTHIYCEVCQRNSSALRKLLATAITFIFVFVWHGCYTYVFIWSVLNFACLVIEKVLRSFLDSSAYIHRASQLIGYGSAMRLRAVVGSQVFIIAALSNVFFVSGLENGYYMLNCAYNSGIGNFLTLSLCSYCFFQCCDTMLRVKKPKTASHR